MAVEGATMRKVAMSGATPMEPKAVQQLEKALEKPILDVICRSCPRTARCR